MPILIFSLCIITISAAYLFLLAPTTRRRGQMETFEKQYVAHRGFFDNDSDAPENSMRAFEKAIQMNYGIELDVQLAKDGELVVFHDASLKRMCGIEREVEECTYEELLQYHLGKSVEEIPRLWEVLRQIKGQVPLVVEIKAEGDWRTTIKKTVEYLDKYEGEFCIQSFHPGVLRWLKKNRPEILRGQLASDYMRSKSKRSFIERIVLSNLLVNVLSRPDFISYNYQYKDQISYKLCRKIFKVKNAGWTIRSQEDLEEARSVFQIMIFDGFMPR